MCCNLGVSLWCSEDCYLWFRPGIDLSQEPPAVRMNDELGGILTFKLKVTANKSAIVTTVKTLGIGKWG